MEEGPDGLLAELHALREENARLRGLLAKPRSEHRRAEDTLEDSEERLRILFEFASDAYYLNDLRGVFLDGNRAAERMVDCKREELIGKSFLGLRLLPPKDVVRAAALLARNVMGLPTGPDEFALNRRDGSRVTVEIRTYPVRIHGRPVVLGIARDITERKRLEARVLEAQKLESLGALAGGVAHRFNNLLTAIMSHADLVLMRLPPESPMRGNLERLQTAAQGAADLASQMLAYSGKGHFIVRPTDLSRVVERTKPLLPCPCPGR